MIMTKGRIERQGVVSFGDASLHVWEEGLRPARDAGGMKGADAWEREFKREVFARIVQTMRRLGWTVAPWDQSARYAAIADLHRTCRKGDLRAELSQGGRHIELEMWQGVNTPTRPDHGGRYEHNKEGCAPYLLRLEMDRTRQRIRDYLCNVFTGYTFEAKRRSIYRKPLEHTALEIIQQRYAESWHFKGDLSKYEIHSYNRKSGDGAMLEHGQRVFFYDDKGRCSTGTALYNINNMWWVVTGKYDHTNVCCSSLFVQCPANPRVRRNGNLRRKRIEALLADATQAMNFERAMVFRDLLFPKGEELFVVWHDENRSFHCSQFNGYTDSVIKAGRFTAAEVKGWNIAPNRVMPLTAAQALS